EWLRDSRAHYESLAIGAMGALLDRASEDDRIEAVDVARSMIAVDATQERAHRTIMAASIAEGRPADALRQYERCAEALKRDLDARPSPETERLMQQARSGETVSISTESGSTSIAAEAVIANEAQPSGSDGIAETVPAAVGHAPPAPAKGGQRSRWVIPVAIAAAFVGLPAAAAGAQYWAAGNRIAPDNLLCRMNLIAKDDAPVKLAGIMPFDQNHGKRQRWGILRYLRDHRASYPFEVTMDIHDSKGDLEETNRILTEMESEKPVAVLGPGQSRIAWDAKKWGNQHQVPMVSSSASAGYLAQPGERDYFFRVGMSDRTRAKSLVDWMQNLGLSQFPYVVHEYAPKTPGANEPDIYGASQAAVAKDNLGRVTTLRFLRGDKESQLAAIDQIKNDGRPIAMFGYTSNLTFMIMEMQKRGIENPIFLTGVVTAALEQAGFPYPDKLHVVTGIVSEARNLATSARLRRIFEDDNPGLDYDLAAWYSYDATEMVMDAVSRARQETCSGTVDGEAVARQLRLTPTKKREVLSTSFLADTQEIFVESDGLKIIDGKFRHVGLGN
ncbi:MAG: ABC transporter substrate-binding protein, partial [Pseudomonadota bacterium]